MEMDVTAVLRQGIAAHEAGDIDDAAAAYRRILDAVPGHADATHLLGVVAFQKNDFGAARERIEAAIGLDGNVALYHANLGRVHRKRDDAAAAVAAFRDAVRLSPDDAALHSDLASAQLATGDADGARARANLALSLDPDHANALVVLGLALQDLFGPAQSDAMTALRRAVEIDPGAAGGYLGLGLGFHEIGEVDAAAQAYRAAIQADPGLIAAHTNLGNILRERLAFADAETCYRNALAVAPENGAVWGNLAVTLQEKGDLEGARNAYDKALAFAPDDAEIGRNRAMALLAAGDFAAGWPAYEARRKTARFQALERDWPVPQWGGESLKRKHLYVHAEQGLGDTLQFCRYVRVLKDRGAKITFECADALRPVLKSITDIDGFAAPGDPLPKIDFHIPLLSIPGWIGLDPHDDPVPPPYLSADPKKTDMWRQRLSPLPPGPKIGIAWRGSPDHARDAVRSPGLAPFRGLLAIPDATLVSLQKEHAADDLAAHGAGIIDWTEALHDFADTAALMAALDVVVSCDTAPLHLAGALGLNCIAVLPHVAEWRWGTVGEKTPWYPSMTLVRQSAFGDWDGAIAAAAVRI